MFNLSNSDPLRFHRWVISCRGTGRGDHSNRLAFRFHPPDHSVRKIGRRCFGVDMVFYHLREVQLLVSLQETH